MWIGWRIPRRQHAHEDSIRDHDGYTELSKVSYNAKKKEHECDLEKQRKDAHDELNLPIVERVPT